MSSREIQKLIQKAERGEVTTEEYHSLIEDLGLDEEEEAFMKMTGTGLIMENRGEEALRLSEQLLEEKYTTDELINRAIDEIDGLSEIYERHMGRAVSSLEYSAELYEEIKGNIEEAESGQVYIDIDIHESGSFWPDINIFGGSDGKEDLEDKDKRDTMKWLAGAGAAGLGLGGATFFGAAAYDELTGEPQALSPGEYDLFIGESDDIEEITSEYENSDTESLRSIGDRLESESGNTDLGIGFRSTYTETFVDVNTGEDLIKRYHLGDNAYTQAKQEAEEALDEDVTF